MRGYYQYYLHDMVNSMSRKNGGLPTTFHHGQVKVTTAGTAVQLSTAVADLQGGIWFKPTSSTNMYVGYADQKPDGTNAVVCNESNPIFVEADRLNDYWIDSAANNKYMSWMAW